MHQKETVELLAGKSLGELSDVLLEAMRYYLLHIESGLLDRAKSRFDDAMATPCDEATIRQFLEA